MSYANENVDFGHMLLNSAARIKGVHVAFFLIS